MTESDERSHDDIYLDVQNGNPDVVEQMAQVWAGLVEVTNDLAGDMVRDLEDLQFAFAGSAGDQVVRRVSEIRQFCTAISEDAAHVSERLQSMAAELREIQKMILPPPRRSSRTGTSRRPSVAGLGSPEGYQISAAERRTQQEQAAEDLRRLAGSYQEHTIPLGSLAAPGELPEVPDSWRELPDISTVVNRNSDRKHNEVTGTVSRVPSEDADDPYPPPSRPVLPTVPVPPHWPDPGGEASGLLTGDPPASGLEPLPQYAGRRRIPGSAETAPDADGTAGRPRTRAPSWWENDPWGAADPSVSPPVLE